MKKVIAFSIAFAPFLASAQAASGVTDIGKLFVFLAQILKSVSVLLLAAAVVFFLWNVFKYVMSAGDGEAKAEANKGIIYGIVGIFIMASVYGLVNFLDASLGLNKTTPVAPPQLNIAF